MKYILMLLISFGAMAESDTKDLERLNSELMQISQELTIQNARLTVKLKKESELSNNYKLYLENISEMCLSGNNFVSIGEGGSIYRFSCDLVEVVE